MPNQPTRSKLGTHDIARLLSASTEDSERRGLLARLAADPDAQELLRMALEALEVTEQTRRRAA